MVLKLVVLMLISFYLGGSLKIFIQRTRYTSDIGFDIIRYRDIGTGRLSRPFLYKRLVHHGFLERHTD